MAASKNEWNYIYQCNDEVTIKCKRKNIKKSEVKEVFSYPRITHLLWVSMPKVWPDDIYKFISRSSDMFREF